MGGTQYRDFLALHDHTVTFGDSPRLSIWWAIWFQWSHPDSGAQGSLLQLTQRFKHPSLPLMSL
jgi:hypothetical protein